MANFINQLYQLALSSHIVSKLLEPAHIIILLLPFLTFLLAIGLLSWQRHRAGGLIRAQVLSIYSFVFYLAALYLLIILPLPSKTSVAASTGAEYNLHPFYFLQQFQLLTPFKLTDPSTWIATLRSDSFFQPFFNMAMMIPLGIFLRKNIHWPFWLTALFGFGLSLFFETMQLTGLYGYYARAYRMFDVDDLMMNTLGTMVGFWLTPLWRKLLSVLPSQSTDQIATDQHHWQRLFALAFDWGCVAIFDGLYFVLVKHFNWPIPSDFRFLYLVDLLIFFFVPALIFNGRTFGNLLLGGQLQTANAETCQPWQIMLHYAGLYLIALPLLFLDVWLFNRTGNVPSATLSTVDIAIVGVSVLLVAISYDLVLTFFDQRHHLLFDRFSHVLMVD